MSEIKRVNNIMTDHEIHALPTLKVPVSRLRLHYLNELHQEQTGQALLGANGVANPLVASLQQHQQHPASATAEPSTDEEASTSSGSARDRIDAILDKTDARLAQARTQLPASPGLEGGAHGQFHFVDASAPDSAVRGE